MASVPAASPAAQSAATQNQKLLEAMVKQFVDKGLDWQKIADEMGSTPGAVRERWRRYKLANGINTTAANEANMKESAPPPGKKTRVPKRKAGDDGAVEESDNQAGTPTKKRAPAVKHTKSIVEKDSDATDVNIGFEGELTEIKSPTKRERKSCVSGQGKITKRYFYLDLPTDDEGNEAPAAFCEGQAEDKFDGFDQNSITIGEQHQEIQA